MGEAITLSVTRGSSGRKETLIVKNGVALYEEDWRDLERLGVRL